MRMPTERASHRDFVRKVLRSHILRATEPFRRRNLRNSQRIRKRDFHFCCRIRSSVPGWSRNDKISGRSGTCGLNHKKCWFRTGCGSKFWKSFFWMENSVLPFPGAWHACSAVPECQRSVGDKFQHKIDGSDIFSGIHPCDT